MPTATANVVTFGCYHCGFARPVEGRVMVHNPYGGTVYVCAQCARNYARCESCGELHNLNNMRRDRASSGRICYDCSERHSTWDSRPMVRATETDKVGSDRDYGIELETSRCPEYRQLRHDTHFGAKYDGSIRGMEFVSPILHGNAGFAEVVDFCSKARRKGFEVDGDCGYHLHINMRDTSEEQRRSVAHAYYRSYAVWSLFVNQYRAYDCSYCQFPHYQEADIYRRYSFDDFADGQDRYEFLNLTAFCRHGTFEIRSYEGTLNAVEICNWVKAHLRFVDYVKDMTREEIVAAFADPATAWKTMKRIFGPDLARYYGRKRAERVREEQNEPNNSSRDRYLRRRREYNNDCV